MTNEDMANLWVLGHRVVGGQDRAAWIAKDYINPFSQQAFHYNI
jgi:hypothetical protein